jgi:hypothetical protein
MSPPNKNEEKNIYIERGLIVDDDDAACKLNQRDRQATPPAASQ